MVRLWKGRCWGGVAVLLLACYCACTRADDLVLQSVKPADTRAPVLKYGLTRADADWIVKNIPGVLRVIPSRVMPQTLRYGELQLSGRLVGTSPRELEYDGNEIARGRYLTENDLQQRHNVAVIGKDVAKRLFAFANPIGKNIRAGEHVFLIVGVARWGGADTANSIHIPISTMRVRYGDRVVRRDSGSFSLEQYELSSIRVVPQAGVDLSQQKSIIEKMLRESRK